MVPFSRQTNSVTASKEAANELSVDQLNVLASHKSCVTRDVDHQLVRSFLPVVHHAILTVCSCETHAHTHSRPVTTLLCPVTGKGGRY